MSDMNKFKTTKSKDVDQRLAVNSVKQHNISARRRFDRRAYSGLLYPDTVSVIEAGARTRSQKENTIRSDQ